MVILGLGSNVGDRAIHLKRGDFAPVPGERSDSSRREVEPDL